MCSTDMATKTQKPQPTEAQLAAIQQYAAENGRTWKDSLRTDWMSARAQINGESSPELQQVRNNFGPAWLATYKLPTIES